MIATARHTIVKVCGLTRAEDAFVAREAGADWIGFVLKGESPRRIDAAIARAIAAAAGTAEVVAVMVSPTPDEALRLATAAGATRVQLHRVDPAAWTAPFPMPLVFVVPVAADGAIEGALPDRAQLVLLDAAHPTLSGGTGQRVPWDVAGAIAAARQVMLAGGLDGDNVGEALAQVRPFGVDAASRLEASPGIKDHEKVRRFVAAVRAHDALGR